MKRSNAEDSEPREKSVKHARYGISRYGVSWKFQLLNTGFVIAIAILIILVVNYIFSSITETASKDYASFYAQDASIRLNTYINHEVELVRLIATSDKLIDWFSDESNEEKKSLAVNEMITVGNLYYSTELYFVIHESLNEYSIDMTNGAQIEDFVPFDVVLPEIEYNRWYFDAIEAENDYSLNIDIDKVTNQRRLWINYKVVKDGVPIGAFCSGLLFDDIFYNLFRQYGSNNVISYIVNDKGILQMDSSVFQPDDILLSDRNIHISEVNSDPAFLSVYEEHTGRKNGMFTEEHESFVLMLPSDSGTYVSIAPIYDSDWSVITFYKSSLLFNVARLQPLLVTILIALVAYSISVIIMSNKLIFTPFRKLLSGYDKVVIEDSENPYTSALRNEFSEVADTLEYIRLMLNAAPICCILWDSNHRIVSCNREVLALYGLKDSDELKERFHELSPEFQPCGTRSREKAAEIIAKGLSEGYYHTQWTYLTQDGKPLPSEMTCIRLRHRGENYLAVYTRDMREQNRYIEQIETAREDLRHALEEAEAANRAKSKFLANMSHEIRTPMNAILGIAEIKLQNTDISDDFKEAFENIYSSGDLLLGIINDILDLSKIEEGKLDLYVAQYDVANLIHDVAALNRLRYEEKPIDFIVNLDENTPRMLTGDEIRIKQILNNLLSNAFKYTKEGEIEFSVHSEYLTDSTVTLVMSVRDTGQGLSSEQINKLFDDYTRFNLDVNRSISGTGLGLSIAKRLIDMMDGEINVSSKPGEGTVFTVRIKQEYEDAAPCGAEVAQLLHIFKYKDNSRPGVSQLTVSRKLSGRVLIVDDVRSNLYVARGLLMPYGLDIDEASNGIEAIRKINENNNYDLIFMDHMMPKMNGIEATKLIREAGHSVPIVALTANAFVGQEEMFLSNGFDGYISKPIDSRELDNILTKFLADN